MKVGIVGAGRAGSACALAADVRGSGAPHLQFEQAQHDMGEGRGYTDLYADDGAREIEPLEARFGTR